MRSTIARPLLALLICLFLIQRIGLLLYGYPHIAHPGFDETASGVLACDLLDGNLRAPLSVYQYESRSGDSLIEGVLLVPFFALFGRSLLSLKVLALASAFCSLLCWISLLRRYQGAWAAIIFAALFALPPPLFSRLTLIGTIASHHLISPLMSLQLLLVFLIAEGGSRRAGPWLWLGVGALAGLGTYTFYTYIIFNLLCAVMLLLFRPQLISVRALLLSGGGFLAGFSPWVAMAMMSGGGGGYLVSILRDIRWDGGVLVRNFFFTVPHSLGYGYPAAGIGLVSLLFFLFMLLLGGRLAVTWFKQLRSLRAETPAAALRRLNPAALLSIALVLYPPFFLLLLSLSPLEIKPFEYWPAVGFFGQFSVADLYRYRWLTSLYPFYLALVAAGMAGLAGASRAKPFIRYAAGVSLVFFLTCGAAKTVSFCSASHYMKVRSYKGFSYDQMGNRFMLRPGDAFTAEQAKAFISRYPEENRAELYKFLGARVMMQLIQRGGTEKDLEEFFQELAHPQKNDALYGIVWAAQHLPENLFQPFARRLADMFSGSFYEMWGYRYLSYRHYLALLNWAMVTTFIPPVEGWFFTGFLHGFEERMQGTPDKDQRERCAEAIDTVPAPYRLQAAKGMGMRVGAEMLFDPVCTADYPLDSRVGEGLDNAARDSFFQGVGSGFAEALCRLWRTLLVPADASSDMYRRALDMEWERCRSLRRNLSSPHAVSVERGFWTGLMEKVSDPRLDGYVRNKRRQEGIDG